MEKLITKDKENILNAHNRERELYGYKPLKFDNDLNIQAQIYAEHLLKQKKMEHSKDRVNIGENLAWSSTSKLNGGLSLFNLWMEEKQFFIPGKFPNVAKGDKVVGHYSQIIWEKSTKLGVGLADGKDGLFLVCRYGPAGNIKGESVGIFNKTFLTKNFEENNEEENTEWKK